MSYFLTTYTNLICNFLPKMGYSPYNLRTLTSRQYDYHRAGLKNYRQIDDPSAHPWVWIVIGLLFVLSVPWYLPSESPITLWFGLPHWVIISLASSFAIAIFTAWVVTRYWSDGAPDKQSSKDSSS